MNVRIYVESNILGNCEVESENLLTPCDEEASMALLSTLLDDANGKIRRAYRIENGT